MTTVEPYSWGTRVHMVGIGGIGVSAIARWLLARGVMVSGSDLVESPTTVALRDQGIPVAIEPVGALPNAHVLVYSDAVPPRDASRVAARERGVKERMYADILGELAAPYHTVAISGSHGKSTTTALTALILTASGHDPTVVIGTNVPQFRGTNFRAGKSNLLVVEADDYRGHCLTLAPTVAVITNTDYDHVDAFPSPAAYHEVFRAFVRKIAVGGTLVLKASDPLTRELIAEANALGRAVLTFDMQEDSGPSIQGEPHAAFTASRPVVSDGKQEFTVFHNGRALGVFSLMLPGEHLVLDALAAIAVASCFSVPPPVLATALASFTGTWRRFEQVGLLHGAPVISDYAHHPTELFALLQATRQWYPGRRIVLAFQPHQKIRTRAFAPAFQDALALPSRDLLILADVYDVAGREETGDATTSRDWVSSLRERGTTAIFAPTLEAVAEELSARVVADDVVLVVGAGTIDEVARRIAQ